MKILCDFISGTDKQTDRQTDGDTRCTWAGGTLHSKAMLFCIPDRQTDRQTDRQMEMLI